MNFLPLWQDASEGRRHPWLPVLSGVMFSIIILTMAAVPARADEAVKGTVKCRSGIVRKTASTTAECAFCVKEGENILILSESEGSDGNKWYQIRLQDQSGYIRSDLVSKSKETVTLNTVRSSKGSKRAILRRRPCVLLRLLLKSCLIIISS